MVRIELANGAVFESAEERIREYCDIEVYRDRNYRGGYDDHRSITDSITAEDVDAAGNLHGRFAALDRGRITHSAEIQERLASVEDRELGELDERQWGDARARIGQLLASFLALPKVTLAECTKIAHLKRPHLVPIIDSLVVKFLTGNDVDSNAFSEGELLQIGLSCMDIARQDLLRNGAAFAQLQSNLADLPTTLSNVRLYSVLCWTEEKWMNRVDVDAPYGVAGKSLNQRQAGPVSVGNGEEKGAEATEPPGEMKGIRAFRQVRLRAEGVVVTTGSKPPRAHRALCRELSEERFTEAVVFNEGKKGRYYLRKDLAEAVKDFGAVACMKCKPERPFVRRD